MKGFPRRGSDVGGLGAGEAVHLPASMKGFPRRGSDLGPPHQRLGSRPRLNEGLPQKGKRSSVVEPAGEGPVASMKGFPRRGSDQAQRQPRAARQPQPQ